MLFVADNHKGMFAAKLAFTGHFLLFNPDRNVYVAPQDQGRTPCRTLKVKQLY
ncbi:hypothetical protein [Rhizobium sp. CF142]|uniref:hypothetical protein n=1 Tax=Rhizobium sp. CF142 TaxID=1144314 RepID=UPI0012F62CCD|nr:hypothetical protein [Rhizobium sp. CF142]